jgi:hypothetical protein
MTGRALRRFWTEWQKLAADIGDFQARLVLTVFYWTVMLPFGLLVRLVLRPMQTRPVPGAIRWLPRATPVPGLPGVQRQY